MTLADVIKGRFGRIVLLAGLVFATGQLQATDTHGSGTTAKPLSRDDIAWLRRDGYDLDAVSVARYRKLGRIKFLDAQLADKVGGALPASVTTMIAGFDAIHTPLVDVLTRMQQENRLRAGMTPEQRRQAGAARQGDGNRWLRQAAATELLQAIYGPNQLKEQMVWFWTNHFSIYQGKGNIRWDAADFAEHSVRPRVLGKFRDLVMATLQSPAMLESLDNTKNAKGKVNENYARELMELQTLGVGSGYTQQDVQQLALILTGVGITPVGGKLRPLAPKFAPMLVREGMFQFDPSKHDFSDKMFLGHTIKGRGFDEVKQAVDLIVHQPACATFISHKLAQYFVADNPPPALVKRMAKAFRQSDGDIAKVLRVMFLSREITANAGHKFKDPTQFLVSAMRAGYDGQTIANAMPLVSWLTQMGEPMFNRTTPDGWPIDNASWTSSGQMSTRFDLAKTIGFGNRGLMTTEGTKDMQPGFPLFTTRLYYETMEPYLSNGTRAALAKAANQQEWNAFLLASPEFNYR